MPELPEVETVRLGLAPVMTGTRLAEVEVRRENLRFAFPGDFAARLRGQTILSLGRRAKYILTDLSNGEVLIMHLGMSGRFIITPPDGEGREAGDSGHEKRPDSRHDHVVFHLSNDYRVTYNDARRFGFMDIVRREELESCRHFAHTGIEPLGNALSGPLIRSLFAGRKAPLKAALLDQRLIAGLGNIYVCEALHLSGLDPQRASGKLSETEADRLADAIREVLMKALEAGGSSLRDYRQADGSPGYFQHSFTVYGREGEPCARAECSGVIERLVQSGRSTFLCPVCQT